MKLNILRRFDYIILISIIVLTSMGIMFIYSSGINSEGVLVSNEYVKQSLWAGIGFLALIVATFIDYRSFRRYIKFVYIAILFVLIYTRLFGRYVNGARSWIGIGSLGIQPSEICKIIYIVFLAYYLESSQNEKPRKRFVFALFIMCIPMALILLQPDLGTASVYLPIFIFMCFIADVPVRYILIVVLVGFETVLFTILPIWQDYIVQKSIPLISILTNQKILLLIIFASLLITLVGLIGRLIFKNNIYYWITYIFGIITVALILYIPARKVLKPYQIQRLIVFLDPSSDPRGAGWNIIQSKIAIGAGGIWGRGFKMGTQSHYRFLPQQSTDFIFSILAEESGFMGGMIVYVSFLAILLRIIHIMKKISNSFGCYIAAGILGMYFFHFIVNVGMVMGIMPITGIPLPFLSYGGSAYITNMFTAGILMSISSRRLDFKVGVL